MSTIDSGKTDSSKLHERLTEIFEALYVIHCVLIICRNVCNSLDFDSSHELAKTFQHTAILPLDAQLRALNKIIEELGGKTEFTE